jgi:anti-sigma factor (TIGR02949 family)
MTDPRVPVIPCDQAVRHLWEYVEHAATPVDHARIEEHLAVCRRCCGEVEFIKHLRQLLANQATDDIPPEALRQLDRFVEEL